MKEQNWKYLSLILVGLLSFLALFLYMLELAVNATFNPLIFCEKIARSFPFMLLIAWVDYKLVLSINRSEWLYKHLLVRIVFEGLALSVLASFFVLVGNIPFMSERNIAEYLVSKNYGKAVVAAILLNTFTVTVIEFFAQNKKHQMLKDAHAKMQYRQLKSQINPHFLFNSLNVLVSLINKDSQRATDYTKKLSDVYRYVLTHDLDDAVPIADEIAFIRNYVEILRIRFGDGLQVAFIIGEPDMQRRIPPMALQVLVENAVKHNAITPANPLNISISSNGQQLTVSNNVIPRMRIEKGMGIGLENLKEKYHIIANKTIDIERNDKEFIVRLPLL